MGLHPVRRLFSLAATAWVAAGASLFMAAPGLSQVAGAPKTPPTQNPLPTPNIPPQSCTTTECHVPIAKHTVRHSQTAADCTACHVQIGEAAAHKFSFTSAKEDLCVKCHQLPLQQHAHAPVKDGKCMDCHDPHGSEFKAELVSDPNRDLCVKCHAANFKNKSFVHGPVAVGACTTCHKPHSSENPKLLLADPNTLCKTCHADTGKPEEGVHIHKALDQGCVNCHDPHASDHKFQLREVAPKLCLTCHKDKFEQATAGAAVVHGAITQDGGCTTCHEPHASKLPGLQRTVQPDTCLKCHDKPLKNNAGKPMTNMAALLAANPEKHGPIREGHCTVCHDPHASPKFQLLSEDYPEKFYSPFSPDLYRLCFKCHSQDLVMKQNGTGITQFRDGVKNLHALHVNQEKGRTCRACHEVHASQRASHVRESVPFGSSNWMLEINFKSDEEGGSCAPGCHAPKTYKRPPGKLAPLTPEPATKTAPGGAAAGPAVLPKPPASLTAPAAPPPSPAAPTEAPAAAAAPKKESRP